MAEQKPVKVAEEVQTEANGEGSGAVCSGAGRSGVRLIDTPH